MSEPAESSADGVPAPAADATATSDASTTDTATAAASAEPAASAAAAAPLDSEDEAETAIYDATSDPSSPNGNEFPPLSQEEEAAFLSWAQAHQSGFVPEDAAAAAAREEEQQAQRIRFAEEERQRVAREARRREREEKKAAAAEREAIQQQQLLAQQQAAAASAARTVSQRSRTSARQSNSPARGGGGALAAPAAAAEADASSSNTSPVRPARAPLSPTIPEPFSSLSALPPADSRSRHLPIGAGLGGSASAAVLPRARGPSQERLPIELKDRKWLSTQHEIAAQNAFLLGRLLAIGQGSAAYYDASHGMKGGAGAFIPPKPHVVPSADAANRKNGCHWDDDARNMLASRRRILVQNAQFKRRRTQAKIERENAIIQERLLKAKHSSAIDPRNHRKSYEAHQHYRELRSHYRVAPSADNAFAAENGSNGPSLALEAAQALASRDNPAATRYTSEQTRQLYTSLSAPNLHGRAGVAPDPHAAERAQQLMRELDAQQQQQEAEQEQEQPEEKSAGSSPPSKSSKSRRPASGSNAAPKNFRAAGGHAYALTPQSIQELMEHVFFAQQEQQQLQGQQRRAQTGQRLKPLPAASRSYPAPAFAQSALGPGLLNGSLSPLANLRSLSPLKNAGASKALQAAALRRAARGGAPETAPVARPKLAPPTDSPYSKQSAASSSSTRSPAAGSTAAPSDRSLAATHSQSSTGGELTSQLNAALGAGQRSALERDLARQAHRTPGEEKEEASHLLSAADQARVDAQIAEANTATALAAEARRRAAAGLTRTPSTFGSSPEDMQDLDDGPEQDAEEEDGFDDGKCLTTPLNVKALSQFMRPVNASKREFSDEELNN